MTETPRDIFPRDPSLIFMGTPEFAVPTLEALIHNGSNILAVVTQPDRRKGRGRKMAVSPVKELALKHHIELLQPDRVSDQAFCDLIQEKAPDLIIVVAFGQILGKGLLDIPRFGAINIHASLLPEYRGAAPIQRVIMDEESVTGLTVMRMDEGLDSGPVLFQEEVPVLEDETAGQLHDRLSVKAGDLMVGSLKRMAGKPIKETAQDDSRATYAHKIGRDIALIDWGQSAANVSAHIRGLDPWPGAYTTIDGKAIKLFSSRVLDENLSDTLPGKVIVEERNIRVETGKGLIEVGEIQYPGRKRLSSGDFLRGFTIPEGTTLGK